MHIIVNITESEIESMEDSDIPDHNTGAMVEFLGIVREEENGEIIKGITYEAYEGMAVKKMKEILEKLAAGQSINAVEVIHRVGWVPVGKASLLIRVYSRHRKEAFELLSLIHI